MKASIRAKLNGEAPKNSRSRQGRPSVRIKSVLSTRPYTYVGWVIDRQSKAELTERELAAKVAANRWKQTLANAQVTGEKCSHRACPYLAVLEGECRQHAADRMADFSVLPSQLGPARELADY